jgi:hypothetical protein
VLKFTRVESNPIGTGAQFDELAQQGKAYGHDFGGKSVAIRAGKQYSVVGKRRKYALHSVRPG